MEAERQAVGGDESRYEHGESMSMKDLEYFIPYVRRVHIVC